MITVIRHRIKKHSLKSILKIRNKLFSVSCCDQLYFAFGANLGEARFQKNFMRSCELGNAYILDYQINFSLPTEYKNKGYAGINPKKGERVEGVLYKLDSLSLSYLDVLEWCGFGAYERKKIEVIQGEERKTAWFYDVKKPDFCRIPSTLYLKNIIATSQERGFSPKYIRKLETQKHQKSFSIDHYFSLRTYSSSRKINKLTMPLFKMHDTLRELLCSKI